MLSVLLWFTDSDYLPLVSSKSSVNYVLGGEVTDSNTNFIMFGLRRRGLEITSTLTITRDAVSQKRQYIPD